MAKKIVLISGSSRGLGASLARSFINNNFLVAINYFKSEKEAKSLSDELGDNAKSFYCDISNCKDVEVLMAEIKESFNQMPSILINNAIPKYVFNGDDRKLAADITWQEIQDHLDVTLKGSLNLIQSLIPSMSENSYGRIINIGTNLVQNPVVPYHDYTIAKSALLGLTRTFAKDLGQMGITVNMISGGLLKITDASAATPDFVFDAIAEMTPLKKVTTIEEFSDVVLFFASDKARSITGQNLIVDGGLTFK
tara:strand:- start:61 stop:816 length:756 start_codon:yes stop_codon:yes gene_type:complete